MKLIKRLGPIIAIIIILSVPVVYFGNSFFIMFEDADTSISAGSAESGTLLNGKRLPSSGENFVTYSRLGSLIGRNYVNDKVKKAIVRAYELVYQKHPEYRFILGESGWKNGGKFWPHVTHQNGTSVDFFVPVKTTNNEITELSCSIFNKMGYSIDFDSSGRYKDMIIDFDAMAFHLLCLEKACKEYNVQIKVVIFDNELQKLLRQSQYATSLNETIKFSRLKPWVRHDEHYHIDFIVQ